MVWLDQNNNGVHDPLEAGIPDVLIELMPAGGGESSLVDSTPLGSSSRYTYTDAAGHFLFENVPVGNYILRETDPEGADPEISNDVTVTVVADQIVEANIRDVPAQWRMFLPLILPLEEQP